MDFVKNLGGSGENKEQSSSSGEQKQGGGGFLGGIGDKINSAAGGGKESEKNEDFLDKGKLFDPLLFPDRVDMVQEKVLGQGPQDNESAIEQAKDEQISDYIRGQYKSTTGTDFPIKDKETKLG
ncbi:MAG: hypothetical protein Q9157_001517 [Trypethelium eluteriae]